jgi:hypothetical protein
MEIRKFDKILETDKQKQLWTFYQGQFAELNTQTPLSQTLARAHFNAWLKSSRAKKFVVIENGAEIRGLAVVSSDLRHDPLISIPYFKTHFSDRKIFHFPVIALARDFASRNPQAHVKLMREMMQSIPANGVAIFFHSENENPVMPRLVRKSCAPEITATTLDAMRCIMLHWTAPANKRTQPETFFIDKPSHYS